MYYFMNAGQKHALLEGKGNARNLQFDIIISTLEGKLLDTINFAKSFYMLVFSKCLNDHFLLRIMSKPIYFENLTVIKWLEIKYVDLASLQI
jgi:hypothetical protein